ncbi:CoA transferase, partial [Delftia sp. BR1]
EHTLQVLRDAGLTEAELAALQASRACSQAAALQDAPPQTQAQTQTQTQTEGNRPCPAT